MNRKSFLKTLFTGLVATRLALQLGASGIKNDYPKEAQPKKCVINPEYLKAAYEMEVVFSPDVTLLMKPCGSNSPLDPFPIRFNANPDGTFYPVPPFLEK